MIVKAPEAGLQDLARRMREAPGIKYTATRANVNGVESFVIRTVPPASPRTARRAILERVGLAIAVVGLLWVVFSVGFALTDRTPPSGGSPPAVAR